MMNTFRITFSLLLNHCTLSPNKTNSDIIVIVIQLPIILSTILRCVCGWLHVVFALPTKNHRIFFRSNLSGIFVEIEPHARAVNTLLIGHTKKKSSRREIGYTHIFLSCLFIQIVCVYILRLCPQRHEGVSISRQRAMFETCDDTLHCIAVLLFIYSFGLGLVG